MLQKNGLLSRKESYTKRFKAPLLLQQVQNRKCGKSEVRCVRRHSHIRLLNTEMAQKEDGFLPTGPSKAQRVEVLCAPETLQLH